MDKEIAIFLAIFSDLLILLILSGCSMTEDGTAGHKQCSIALIVMFCIVGVAYIATAGIIGGLFGIKGTDFTARRLLFYFIQVTAGLLYYFGDNLDNILTDYGSDIGCMQTCIRRVQSASFVFLFLAEMLYLVVERGKIFKEFRNLKEKPSSTWSVFINHLLPIILFVRYLPKIDAIYTAITLTTKLSNSTCEEFHDSYEAVAWAYFSLIPAVLLAIFFTTLIYHWVTNNWENDWGDCLPKCILGSCQAVSAIAVAIMISLYLLADNMFPLDCVSDSERTVGVMRLTLSSIAIVMILLVLLVAVLVSYCLRRLILKQNSRQTSQTTHTETKI